MKILFVCTGNTCRSPMAEHLFRNMAEKEKLNVEVRSAGISAYIGSPASKKAVEALKEKGVQASHKSRPLNKEMIDWADLVLTMTESHKQLVINRFPKAVDKVFVLKEFVENDQENVQKIKRLAQLYMIVQNKQMQYMTINEEEWENLKYHYEELKKEMEAVSVLLMEKQREWENLTSFEMEEISMLKKELPSYDIPDPIGGELDQYRDSLQNIEEALQKLKQRVE